MRPLKPRAQSSPRLSQAAMLDHPLTDNASKATQVARKKRITLPKVSLQDKRP